MPAASDGPRPKGMGATLLPAPCQGGGNRQAPSAQCYPQTPLLSFDGCPTGVRRGHEDRAELFLLEASRAGTKTNLQAPLLKCHPSPCPPPGWSASCVRATRQRQGLHFASAKSQAKPPASRAVLLPPPWRLQAQLGPGRGRAGHSPSPLKRGELCMRGCFGEGQEHSSTEVPGNRTQAAAPSGTSWRTLGESKPCSLSRAAAVEGK